MVNVFSIHVKPLNHLNAACLYLFVMTLMDIVQAEIWYGTNFGPTAQYLEEKD